MFPVLFVCALVQAHDACKHDQGFVVACGERGGGRGAQAAAPSAGARDNVVALLLQSSLAGFSGLVMRT